MILPEAALVALDGMTDAEVEAVVYGLPDGVVAALVADPFPPAVVAAARAVVARSDGP